MLWTRREFVKGMSAATAGLAGARILSGCSGCEAPREPMELRHLHFDLSDYGAERRFTIRVGTREARLRTHDVASRARHRQRNPYLASVPDENLTHYVEDLVVPADRLALLTVTVPHAAGDGRKHLLHAGLHVPAAALGEAAAIRRSSTARGRAASGAARRTTSGAAMPSFTTEQIQELQTTYDGAALVVFHHPELFALDPTAAGLVMAHIQSLGPWKDCYVTAIESGGVPTDACRRAPRDVLDQLVAVMDGLGTPDDVLDDPDAVDAGWVNARTISYEAKTVEWDAPTWHWVLSDDPSFRAAAARAVAAAVALVRNDPGLVNDGSNPHPMYQVLEGSQASDARGSSPASAPAAARTAMLSSSAYTATSPKNGVWASGVRLRLDGVDANRGVTFTVDNAWFRHCGVYVAARRNDGSLMNAVKDNAFNLGSNAYLGILTCPGRILGVPIDSFTSTQFTVSMPEEAATLSVLVGTLGSGSVPADHAGVDAAGAALTAIFEFLFPSAVLAAGAAGAAYDRAIGMVASVAADVVQAGIELWLNEGQGSGDSDPDFWTTGSLATAMLAKFLCRKMVREAIVEAAGEEAAVKATPILGWAFWCVDLAASMAELGESSAAVAGAQRFQEAVVTVAHQIRINVTHDPSDTLWPQNVARAVFTVVVNPGLVEESTSGWSIGPSGRTYVCEQPFSGTAPCPVYSQLFTNIPSGGRVLVVVELVAGNGWLAGMAMAQGDNVTPDGQDALEFDLAIEEFLVPLSEQTTYYHQMKTQVDPATGRVVWGQAPPPRTVAPGLVCSEGLDALCEPGIITLSNKTGQIATAFESASSGVALCRGSALEQGFQVRNVNLNVDYSNGAPGFDPECTLRQSPCGSLLPVVPLYGVKEPDVVYLLAPLGGTGPYYLRVLPMPAPAGSGKPGSGAPGSWGDPDGFPYLGRFRASVIRCARVHVNGYVVALHDGGGQLEVLDFGGCWPLQPGTEPELQPSSQARVPFASVIAGPGDQRNESYQVGTISGAVSVALHPTQDAILVLEQDSYRIQALDHGGGVLNGYFASAPGGNWVPVQPEPDGTRARLLDVSVENTGHVYVLSSASGGWKAEQYNLDLYGPDGKFMSRTTGVAAARMAVDLWRRVYTVNYESISAGGRVVPSVSEWIPIAPGGSTPGDKYPGDQGGGPYPIDRNLKVCSLG